MRIVRRVGVVIGVAFVSCGLIASAAVADGGANSATDENGRVYYDNAPVKPGSYGVVDDGDNSPSRLSKSEGGGDDISISPQGMQCGSWKATLAPATVNGWGPVSKGCYVLGKKGVKVGYNWKVNPVPIWGSPAACTQVRGYNSSKKSTWYNAGCGESGSLSAPWGNVASSKAARAKSAKTVVTNVRWQ